MDFNFLEKRTKSLKEVKVHCGGVGVKFRGGEGSSWRSRGGVRGKSMVRV